MTTIQKQCLLRYLGYYTGGVDGVWGNGSQAALEWFQRETSISVDGIWGEQTETRILEAVYMDEFAPSAPVEAAPDTNAGDTGTYWDGIKHFTRDEFKCQCYKYNSKPHCDGFPAEMQEAVVRLADAAREHFGRPATVVSGLRCPAHNSDPRVGGVHNSQHMYGEACDIYISGIPGDTVVGWFLSQPGVRYAYKIKGTNNVHFDIPKGAR